MSRIRRMLLASTSLSDIIYNEDGSVTEIIQNDDITIEKTTKTEEDGSIESHSIIIDSSGNITGKENFSQDTDGNKQTQTIEVDENGIETVTGYTIDTTNSSSGNGVQLTGQEVDTEYYAFDTTHAFELMIHFYFDPAATGNVNQSTVLNAKRADPEPWYGFDIRRNGTTNKIQAGGCFSNGTNNRPDITLNSNKIYKIKINYDPTVTSGNTFIMYDMINNKNILTSTLKFPDSPDLKYLKITIGCALDKNGVPQRRAIMNVYDFYVKRL